MYKRVAENCTILSANRMVVVPKKYVLGVMSGSMQAPRGSHAVILCEAGDQFHPTATVSVSIITIDGVMSNPFIGYRIISGKPRSHGVIN